MSNATLVIPHLRACAWFEEDPQDPRLGPGSGAGLDLTWGKPDVDFVDPMQKRRLSRMARGFFHCAQRLSPPGDVRLVFASRHGEADRTLSILQEMAAEREVSPALFSMSVHNAVPGLWSILKGNHAPISALAAGPETFGWGLVEATAAFLAQPEEPVLYVYADDRLPSLWAGGAPQPGLHAMALLLGGSEGRRLTIHREAAEAAPSLIPLSHHFLAAWRGDGTPWQGSGCAWRWGFE